MTRVNDGDYDDEEIEAILRVDPLGDAAKICRVEDYRDAHPGVGLLLLHAKAAQEKLMLQNSRDTYRNQNIDEFVEVVTEFGFDLMLRLHMSYMDKNYERPTCLYVFYNRKRGILMHADEWHFESEPDNRTVSHAIYYYQARPLGRTEVHHQGFYTHVARGGCWDGWPLKPGGKETQWWEHPNAVYNGYGYGQPALKHRIRMMDQHCEFVVPWRQPVKLYLHTGRPVRGGQDIEHFRESDKKHSEGLTQLVLDSLPKDVQDNLLIEV